MEIVFTDQLYQSKKKRSVDASWASKDGERGAAMGQGAGAEEKAGGGG